MILKTKLLFMKQHLGIIEKRSKVKMSDILPLSKKCDHCGSSMIVKVRAAPGRPILQWYYYCHACDIRDIFLEEPLDDVDT